MVAMALLAAIAGTWRGDSVCTVEPSACRHESVVYHISVGKPITMAAYKIVDGKKAWMGSLTCTWDAPVLTCPIPKGTFRSSSIATRSPTAGTTSASGRARASRGIWRIARRWVSPTACAKGAPSAPPRTPPCA